MQSKCNSLVRRKKIICNRLPNVEEFEKEGKKYNLNVVIISFQWWCDWDHIEYRYSGSRSHSLYRHISLYLFHLFRLSKRGCIWTLCSNKTIYKKSIFCFQETRSIECIHNWKIYVYLCWVFCFWLVLIFIFIDMDAIFLHFRHYLREKSKLIEITRARVVIIQYYSIHRIPYWVYFISCFAFSFRHFFRQFRMWNRFFSLDIFFASNLVMRVVLEFRNGKFLWQEIKNYQARLHQ